MTQPGEDVRRLARCAECECHIRLYQNRWVHLDTGLALCDPTNRPTVKARPKA